MKVSNLRSTGGFRGSVKCMFPCSSGRSIAFILAESPVVQKD